MNEHAIFFNYQGGINVRGVGINKRVKWQIQQAISIVIG